MRAPLNVDWIGVTSEQRRLLKLLAHVGNNGWARTAQTEALVPKILGDLATTGMTIDDVREAMLAAGCTARAAHMLERWESKRTTGKFGR